MIQKPKTQKGQAPNKIYTWTIDFTDLIICMKKLLDSYWLRAVQLGNNPSILIGQ